MKTWSLKRRINITAAVMFLLVSTMMIASNMINYHTMKQYDKALSAYCQLNSYYNHIDAATSDIKDYLYTYGIIPTVEGLANSLHIAVNTLLDWEKNKSERRGNSRTVRASLVKNAKQRIQDFDTKLAMMGEISPPVYIFRGKNYYGMRDEVETTVHHDNTNALQSKDEIQQRIMQGLPDDG